MSNGQGRRVTAADVAKSLGLSRTTVGYVLNNTPGQTIPAVTRERVLAEAERLGYRPHRAAQDLRRGSSRVVLLVLPDWRMEYRLRRHLEETARALDEAGYSLAVHPRQPVGRARPLWELLSPDVVLGLLPFGDDEVASMRACGITRISPAPGVGPALDEVPAIAAGAELQVEYLHGLGHRRLAYATTADAWDSALPAARTAAARRAAARLGLEPPDVRPIDYRDGSGAEAVAEWRAAGVTGVVAYNDDVAAAVVGAALRAGVSVPGGLSVVGHDDSPIAAMYVPSLSSVGNDAEGLGRAFADLALRVATGQPLPERDVDPAVFVAARESTAAAP